MCADAYLFKVILFQLLSYFARSRSLFFSKGNYIQLFRGTYRPI